jgi:hypothetical protein
MMISPQVSENAFLYIPKRILKKQSADTRASAAPVVHPKAKESKNKKTLSLKDGKNQTGKEETNEAMESLVS